MEDGLIARHGWAALLNLLQMKGIITDDEARAVVSTAHASAERADQWKRNISGGDGGAAAFPSGPYEGNGGARPHATKSAATPKDDGAL